MKQVNRLTHLLHPIASYTTVTSAPGRRKLHRRRSLIRSVRCALRGLVDAWESEPNLRMHVYFGAWISAFGVWTRLSANEWLWIVFAIGLVIFAELMNTAIEQTVDLVVGLRPDPMARQVKDVAAACVLVASLIAALIGGLTFVPHLFPKSGV